MLKLKNIFYIINFIIHNRMDIIMYRYPTLYYDFNIILLK